VKTPAETCWRLCAFLFLAVVLQAASEAGALTSLKPTPYAALDQNLGGRIFLADGTALAATPWADNTFFAVWVSHGGNWTSAWRYPPAPAWYNTSGGWYSLWVPGTEHNVSWFHGDPYRLEFNVSLITGSPGQYDNASSNGTGSFHDANANGTQDPGEPDEFSSTGNTSNVIQWFGDDNWQQWDVILLTRPDLSIDATDVVATPSGPVGKGSPVSVNATLRNSGDREEADAPVRLTDGMPPAPRIGSDAVVPSLGMGGTMTVGWTWVASTSGLHHLCASADPDGVIAERNETNNGGCVDVAVVNGPPMVNASAFPDQALRGEAVTLNGSGSSDPDNDTLTFDWTQTGGAAVTLAGASTSTASFIPTLPGGYTFSLTVDDGDGGTANASVSVIVVNREPLADAGLDQPNANRFTAISLNGTGSVDADNDSLSFSWSQVAGPIAVTLVGASSPTPTFTADILGGYSFSLLVQDPFGASGTDSVNVTVLDRAPSAVASHSAPAKWVDIVLDATRSTDPDGDPLSFNWIQVSGPAVSIADATAATASFQATVAGTYRIRLDVDDGVGGRANATLAITVINQRPTVVADADRTAVRNASVVLGATALDPDGDPITFQWSQVAGPPAVLTGANTTAAGFQPISLGIYTFAVSVFDGDGGFATDWVNVTVINRDPFVDVGPDRNATAGTAITLRAEASDPDGDLLSYGWTQEAGPVLVLSGVNGTLTFTPTQPSTYVFRVNASDAHGGRATDTVTVVVAQPMWAAAEISVPLTFLMLSGAALALAFLLFGFETSRVTLLTLLLTPVGRKKYKDKEDPEIRGMIRGYIRVHPGDTYSDIKRNLDLNDGTMTWHLAKLEKAGIIKSRAQGTRRKYYPAGPLPPENGEGLFDLQRRLLEAVIRDPGKPVRILAEELVVSEQLALYHLRKLSQRDLLSLDRTGLRLRAFPRAPPPS